MFTPLPSTQKTQNEKMTHLAKSSLPVKHRYFLTTNQLFCFRFDIEKVIRQTYTHTCMHTNIHLQRCTNILAYMHEFIHKNKPPLSHRPQTMGKRYSFIHSGYFYRASLSPLLLRGAPDHAQQLALCRSLHAEALQATVNEGLAQSL